MPAAVTRLLTEHVRSLMALELLLLIRSEPDRERSADELSRELRSTSAWTKKELDFLVSRGLAAGTGASPKCFRYARGSAEIESAMDWLAASYHERRFSIIQLIYPAPSDPIRDFAEAFRIRKDRPE